MRFTASRIWTRGVATAALIGCLAVVSISKADAVIDDFNTLQMAQGGPGGGAFGPISNTVVAGGILGGSRTMSLSGSAFPSQTVTMATGFGFADFQSGSASFGAASLLYNGGGAGLGALLAMTQAIELTVTSFNLGAAPTVVSVTIKDGANTFTSSVTLTASTSMPTSYTFDFTGSGLDFNNITSLLLSLGGGATFGADITLERLIARMTPVPEPTSIAVWSVLGGLGVVCVRRLRRTAA